MKFLRDMKKILSYITMAVLGAGMFASCSAEFLNRTDPNKIVNEKYWKDKTDAESALAAAYSPIKFQMYGYYGAFDGWLNNNSRADDIYTVRNEEIAMWNIATYQNSSTTGNDPYGSLYTGIQRANVLIKYIDTVPADKISDADRAMMKAEAMVLRAYQYYLLVINYGGAIPLRTIPSNEDEPNKGPAGPDAVWGQIESDLLAVLGDKSQWTEKGGTAGDPLPIDREASQKGRIEKGTALAFLAKAYAEQHRYGEAKEVLKVLCEAPYYGSRYKLVDNFTYNFIPDTENNTESVFELQYTSSGSGSWGNESGINLGSTIPQFIGPAVTGGWAKLMPSAYAVYEFVKELRPAGADSKFDKRLYVSMFFKPEDYGDQVGEQAGDWYDPKIYGGAEQFRFDNLWKRNEAKMSGGYPDFTRVIWQLDQDNQTDCLGNLGIEYDGEGNRNPESNSFDDKSDNIKFLLKKYTAWWNGTDSPDSMGNSTGCSNNVRVLRFSEILLLYAEACMKTSDDATAQWAVNEVRQRAGLEKTSKTGQELWEEMEHQCLLEFFGEGHRFYDLKRWYVDGTDDNGWENVKEILSSHYRDGIEMNYTDWDDNEVFENENFAFRRFERKHLYFPIPTGELNNNSAMSQNPVWL